VSNLRVIVLDIEIAKEVNEIGGWDAARHGAAGISSVALYDSATERIHVYGPTVEYSDGEFAVLDYTPLEACTEHINKADIVVGFNNINFDIPAYEGTTEHTIYPEQYDILDLVWMELGYNKTKGYKLSDICKRTLDKDKSGTGEHAPLLFKQGRFAELYDYNINDVMLTRELCNYIEEHGCIVDVNGEPLELPKLGVKI